MPNLVGSRVVLRAIEKKDISNFLIWFNDAEVIRGTQMYLPMTEISEEKWIEKMSFSQSDIVFVICTKNKDDLRPIGTCGLHQINWKDRCATAGIVIGDKRFWKNGFGLEASNLLMTYAFSQLNLHRISSSAYSFNKGSLALHQKLGFQVEGKKRKAIFRDGLYWDIIEHGLLEEEWQK